MRRFALTLTNCIVIAALTLAAVTPALAQAGEEDAFIAELLDRMSSEVRIGQLFVVAFDGTDTSANSDIADLILNYHVGGVILNADHGNIVDSGDRTPAQVTQLTAALQLLVMGPNRTSGSPQNPPSIPLFVAIEQDGGGPAYSAITSGLTPQPGPLALGATWNPADAEAMGQIVGGELSALGVNFLLGPSLDLLDPPDPNGGDVGIRAFGGDPYWVGTLAGAFVRGVRAGSTGRIAVALKHFPGEGDLRRGSDTIDKSLDQLQRIDLAPYFALMKPATGETRPLADAVLTTHARYRGFTALRDRTAPMNVDAAALNTLLQLPDTAAWRAGGGLMVSGSLGADALRRSYDDTLTTFPAEKIALDAFLAGNDVLVLSDFSLNRTVVGEAQTIRAAIRFFQQKYREDLDFQDRVSRAVVRILRLKYRMYPKFVPTDVIAGTNDLESRLALGLPVVERVAQDSLTRVYPSAPAVEAAPLPVPSAEDRFLIFTDDRSIVDCSRCPVRGTLSTAAMSQTLSAVGGVPGERITSLGFADLKSYLARSPAARDLTETFAQANWIILATQDLDAAVQQADAARTLLRNNAALIAGKRVVVFAFGPPHEVSAEDLRLVTADYALYSNATPFVETAFRALFGQVQAKSAPPISVDAIGYDLKTQTEPDPNQSIVPVLYLGEPPQPGTPTPAPPSLRVGDAAHIHTATISDRNGNPVPDGTPVRFTLIYRDADNATEKVDAITVDGSASIDVTIKNNGRLDISAASEPALKSVVLQLRIAAEGLTVIQTIVPPTPTPTLRPTQTPSVTPTPTITPTPVGYIESLLGGEPRRVNLVDFVLSIFGIVLVGAWGYRVEARRGGEDVVDRAVRRVLWGSLCGLVAYSGYGLGLPGADALRATFGGWAALFISLAGAVAPWVVDRVTNRQRING